MLGLSGDNGKENGNRDLPDAYKNGLSTPSFWGYRLFFWVFGRGSGRRCWHYDLQAGIRITGVTMLARSQA